MTETPVHADRRRWLLPAGLAAFGLLVHFALWRETGFYDRYDTDNYYAYGRWLATGERPYTDLAIPYPQLAVYLFAVPHLVLGPGSALDTPRNYKLVFSLGTLGLLWLCIVLCRRLRADRRGVAYLLLLPASLFFAHQRYDIVPALFCLLALEGAEKKKYCQSAFWLALGAFSKWYPLLLAPLFLKHHLERERRFPFRPLAVFVAVSLALAALTVLHSGWEALWSPLAGHLRRGYNQESLFYHLSLGTEAAFGADLSSRAGYAIFLALQLVAVPLCFLRSVADTRRLVQGACLVLLSFLLFAKFYSPQWILWLLPWLVLAAGSKRDVLLLVAFDLVTYLYFPLAYKNFGPESTIFAGTVLLKNALLATLLFFNAKDFFCPAKPSSPSGAGD